MPILKTLRQYNRHDAVIDLLCGLSVGFLHLPQGLGFGILASLQPVHGLYSSFFPVLVYMFFGTSPHVSMGTNAVVALLSANVVDRETAVFVEANKGSNRSLEQGELIEFKVGRL